MKRPEYINITIEQLVGYDGMTANVIERYLSTLEQHVSKLEQMCDDLEEHNEELQHYNVGLAINEADLKAELQQYRNIHPDDKDVRGEITRLRKLRQKSLEMKV